MCFNIVKAYIVHVILTIGGSKYVCLTLKINTILSCDKLVSTIVNLQMTHWLLKLVARIKWFISFTYNF